MRTRSILSALVLAGVCAAAAPAFAQGPWERDTRDATPVRVDDHRDRDARMDRDAYRGRDDHRDRDWREGRRAGPPAYAYGARGPQWRPGVHVPAEYRSRAYVVDNWRAHRLPPPHRGYHWIQVGGDFVLVADGSGVIVQVLLG